MVIGLGRFGTAVATQLQDLGHEVMGIESDPGWSRPPRAT